MAERWVVNASPLIALARVGRCDWLRHLSDELVVPAAVIAEILAGPEDEAHAVLATGGIRRVDTPPATAELAGWSLGAGETAVIAWATAETGWTAVIDDLAARRCARSLGVRHIGTLAVVIRARLAHLTPSAAQVIQDLRRVGLYLDDALVAAVLRRTVGEDWP